MGSLTGPQRRLALWQAGVTAMMTLTAGATLADFVSQRVAGLLTLGAASLNAGTTTYLAAIRPPDTVEGQRSAAA